MAFFGSLSTFTSASTSSGRSGASTGNAADQLRNQAELDDVVAGDLRQQPTGLLLFVGC